jgi:hypothetical protein
MADLQHGDENGQADGVGPHGRARRLEVGQGVQHGDDDCRHIGACTVAKGSYIKCEHCSHYVELFFVVVGIRPSPCAQYTLPEVGVHRQQARQAVQNRLTAFACPAMVACLRKRCRHSCILSPLYCLCRLLSAGRMGHRPHGGRSNCIADSRTAASTHQSALSCVT